MSRLSKQGTAMLLCALALPCVAQDDAIPAGVAAGVVAEPAWVAAEVAAVVSELPAVAGAPAGKLRPGGAVFAAPLAQERLAELRGGSDTPWSDMKLSGTVSGNSAVAVATGGNMISEGAFTNASGLPMVIQNSGANVLIQNATIINVQFK